MTIVATARNDLAYDDRLWGGVLIATGMVALGVSMYMNGRFGWSLMPELGDRIAMATIHVLVDIAAGGLVAAGGRMLARQQHILGPLAMLFAACLVAYSMVSVYGFMSARIATTKGHKAAISTQEGQLKWLRQQTVNRELPKSERRAMGKEVRDQVQEIQRSVGIMTDAQAASIADATGFSVEQVQKVLVMISSGVAQTIKYICMLIGFYLWSHRRTLQNDTSSKAKDEEGKDGGKKSHLRLVSDAAIMQHDAASVQSARDNVAATMQHASAKGRRISAEQVYDYVLGRFSQSLPRGTQERWADEIGCHPSMVSRAAKKVRKQQRRAQREVSRRAARAASKQQHAAFSSVNCMGASIGPSH